MIKENDWDRFIYDLMIFLLGATDTTPSSVTQGLLRLKIHPDKTKLLEKDILKNIPDDFDLSNLTIESVDKCEYLQYFCKELLWIDPPIVVSIVQVVKEKFQIDDMHLLKETDIRYNIVGSHYNTNQWIDPYEFIPERFDPSSKYYLRPDGG